MGFPSTIYGVGGKTYTLLVDGNKQPRAPFLFKIGYVDSAQQWVDDITGEGSTDQDASDDLQAKLDAAFATSPPQYSTEII